LQMIDNQEGNPADLPGMGHDVFQHPHPGDQPPAFRLGGDLDPLCIHAALHSRSAAKWPENFSGSPSPRGVGWGVWVVTGKWKRGMPSGESYSWLVRYFNRRPLRNLKIGSRKRALEIFRDTLPPQLQRPQRRLFEREARVSSLQRSEGAQGRKMSSARRDHDFQRSLGHC
jgi:hypothetical protein